MQTASDVLTRRRPAKWAEATLVTVMVLFGVISSAEVLKPHLPAGICLTLATVVGTTTGHELSHLVAYRWLGGRPRLGSIRRGGLAVALCDPGFRTTVRSAIRIQLAPLAFLTPPLATAYILLAVREASARWLVLFALVVNSIGSAGDVHLARRLRKCLPGRIAVDDESGWQVFYAFETPD